MKRVLLAIAVSLLPALAVPQTVTQQWAVYQTPAAATQATIGKAAVAARRHVATSVTVCLNAVAAQAAPVVFNLRDGATGAGTVKWSVSLIAPAGYSQCVALPVNIPGSTNTAMTLESAAAPAASNFATVALSGYDTY